MSTTQDLHKELTKEYARLHPQWMDLVNDVGATELFFIDGDSLLLDLVHSQDANIDWSYGGQFLHLTFMVERYLSWFKQRGGNFRLVFFNSNRALWIKPGNNNDFQTFSKLAAREAIIKHLQSNSNVIVDVFDTWIVPEDSPSTSSTEEWTWNKALHMFPAFIATSDAECIADADPEAALLLRSFLFFASSHRNATVMTSSVTIDNNRVMGFVVRYGCHVISFLWLSHVSLFGKSKCRPHIHIGWRKFIPECQRIIQEREALLPKPAQATSACIAPRAQVLKKVLPLIQETSPEYFELKKTLALHAVLLDMLPLAARNLRVPTFDEASRGASCAQKFLGDFFKALFLEIASQKVSENQERSLADLFDGRLLFTLIDLFTRPDPNGSELQLSDEMITKMGEILGSDSRTVPYFRGAESSHPPAAAEQNQANALFPLTSSWVSDVLGETLKDAPALDENDPAVLAASVSGQSIVEENGWNTKQAPLMDAFWEQTSKGGNTGEGGGGWKQVRAEQFLARFIHQYAESLEGSATLHQKTIVLNKQAFIGGETPAEAPTASTDEEPAPATSGGKKGAPKKGAKPPKGGAPKKKSKAEEIREANLARLKKKEEDGELQRWNSIKVQLEDWIKTDPPRVEPTVKEFVKTCPVSSTVLEAQMWRLQFYYRKWRTNQTNDELVVNVFNQVHRIADHHMHELDERNVGILQQVLMDMGFEDSTKLLISDLKIQKPSYTETNPGRRSSIKFMMQHMGHLLKRKDSSGPDPRVGFVPDNWQRELLDVVDRRGSALVCAPTSSGKTFISYYCMEQVLREGPHGVAVFVSPTKALVNQVAAEVYARFGNLQSQYGDGSSVFGYFTRDYRYKPLKCRVLVTVPECLEMLLLSAQPQFEEWRKRISYVIFDEVHSIGDLASGEIWEHVMSLVDCPILALSATVRNPDDLKQWIEIRQKLQQIQEEKRAAATANSKRSYEVALIAHHNRYADLEKSVFLPVLRDPSQPAPVLESAWKLEESQQGKFFRLHPCVSLSGRRIREFGFPSDVSFEPRDSLELFEAMMSLSAKLPEDKKSSLKALDPDTIAIFQGVRRITRPMTRQYEKLIKAELARWAQAGLEALVDEVISILSASYRQTMAETEKALEKLDTKMESKKYLYDHIVDVIFTLASQDRLPVILFNYDAELCEKLLELLVERLEKEEYRKSQTQDSVKERRQLQKAREQQARKQKLMRDSKLKEKTAIELVQKEHDDAFIPEEEEVDREFSFCASDVEISKEALDIIKSYPAKFPWVRAVKRGIGIHHAGLPTKYRQAVERLFRVRAIQVVFATSTLSLGIHMPCKTVVFAGDSVNLNALSFRQMSGRAGRRGFDKLGKVAFVGIPDSKINRLLTGDLPVLQGSIPSSVGLVHRCENLHHFGSNRVVAQDASVRMFQKPLAGNINEHDLKMNLRFAEELLCHQGIIDANGAPIGFSELAAYLYWLEPSNYVLIPLIRSGILYSMTDELLIKSKGIESSFHELLQLFSTIVSPQRLHRSILRDTEALTSTSSKIALERPSSIAYDFIKAFNSGMIDSFVSFISAASPFAHQKDSTLPISSLGFTCDYSLGDNTLILSMKRRASKCLVRSPFASTGAGDTFSSLQELVCACKNSIYVDSSTFPYIDGLDTTRYILNRYALDFYEHSNLDLLRSSNALHGSAWLTLNSFVMAMQGIRHALVNIQPTQSRDQFVHIFAKLVDEYTSRFNRLTWFS